jgi:GTP diphosphokinase / guanosine-3',5'-bis(diphosphate) 3'-diphosphatase
VDLRPKISDLTVSLDRHGQLADRDHLIAIYKTCQKLYKPVVRYSGEPVIRHCLRTAITLSELGQDQTVAETALVHELLDQGIDLAHIPDLSVDVVHLANLVHKVGDIRLRGSQSQEFVENLRKMFIVMAQDIRVVYIRLADRLDNIRTLDAVPISKQGRIARETIEIYSPLAERFGIGKLKGELEDLSFAYADPRAHQAISQASKKSYQHAEHRLRSILVKLRKNLVKYQIVAQVSGRQKHLYSLFKKLQRPEINQDIDKVHDLIAIRIITSSVMDCYTTLGLVHTIFKPVPHISISDFIAQPKPNGYQSIHTKVFDSKGYIFEVQIRTHDMHQIAEYGLASHASYSEAKNTGVTDSQLEQGIISTKQSDWLDLLHSWQKDIRSQEEYAELVARRIYVLSPKGDVYDLPEDATPIDYAVSVHSRLILHLHSIKINQRIAKLDTKLKNGDVVEIIKSKNPTKPKKDWLRFVRTSKARYVIRRYL